MDQVAAWIDQRDQAPVTVTAPRDWDDVGQALRAAYRNHRDPPSGIAAAMRQLGDVD